jgi:hypothetical protein
MAVYRPTLDDPSKRVLRVLRDRGVAPGWQLMSEASVTGEELINATRTLLDMDLIKASGGCSNPKEIEQAYFNILPSNARLAEAILSP